MRIPVTSGIIDRRILVNYRIDYDVLAGLLPAPFRPKRVHGYGIGGICLIRLRNLRPRFLPAALGICSENAAHRIAVEWDEAGQIREGVYIPRRDTSSRLSVLVGGRIFPGVHHRARFHADEKGDHYRLTVDSVDRKVHLALEGRRTADLPPSSTFQSLRECSDFFARGSLGYSTTNQPDCFDGLELRTFRWHVEPLALDGVESSFFDDRQTFPEGSVRFDSALLMRDVEHEWHARNPLGSRNATAWPLEASTPG